VGNDRHAEPTSGEDAHIDVATICKTCLIQSKAGTRFPPGLSWTSLRHESSAGGIMTKTSADLPAEDVEPSWRGHGAWRFCR